MNNNFAHEKTGSVLGAAAIAAGIHALPNVGMKVLHSTQTGKDLAADMARVGYFHGKSGKQLATTKERFTRLGIGPEALIEYKAGHAAGVKGLKLKDVHKDLARQALEHGSAAAATPGAHSAFDTISHALKRQGTKQPLHPVAKLFAKGAVPIGTKATLKENIMHAGALAAATAVEPHAAIQPAISKIREVTGKSTLGKKFMAEKFKQGLKRDMLKWKEHVYDYGLSPGALTTYRAGKALREAAVNKTDTAQRAVHSVLQPHAVGAVLKTTATAAAPHIRRAALSVAASKAYSKVKEKTKSVFSGVLKRIQQQEPTAV